MISKGEQLQLEREARDRFAKRRSVDKEEECYYSVINQVFLRGREMLFLRGTAANTVASYRRKNMMHGAPRGVNRFFFPTPWLTRWKALHYTCTVNVTRFPFSRTIALLRPSVYNAFAVSCNRSNLKS